VRTKEAALETPNYRAIRKLAGTRGHDNIPVINQKNGFGVRGCFAALRFQLAAGDSDGGIVLATSVPQLPELVPDL
jgi:hypothetical protein